MLSAALLLSMAAAIVGAAGHLVHAQPPSETEFSLPNNGDVQWLGTIQGMRLSGDGKEVLLTLAATQKTAPDGTVTTLDTAPLPIQRIRVTGNTRLSFAQGRLQPVLADLDYNAVVTVNCSSLRSLSNKNVNTPNQIAVARAVRIEKTASEVMGTNLLPGANEPKGWYYFLETDRAEGAIGTDTDASSSSDSFGALRVTVTKTTGTDWHAQLLERAPLKAGVTYTLRFRAHSDVPRLITLDSQTDSSSYRNAGLYQVVPLDTDWRAYRTTFTATSAAANAESASQAKITILVGGRVGTVWLADVSLVEGDHALPTASRASPAAKMNLLIAPNEPNCWMLKAIAPADAAFTGKDHALKITITKLDDKRCIWGTQLFQMTDIEPGRAYALTFLAKADAPRALGLWAWIDNGHYRRVGLETTVDLSTDWLPYRVTFTATTPLNGHTKAPCFCVGNALGTVWLSNVVLSPL